MAHQISENDFVNPVAGKFNGEAVSPLSLAASSGPGPCSTVTTAAIRLAKAPAAAAGQQQPAGSLLPACELSPW